MVVGLIAGYLNEGTSKAITLKKVGVRDGEIKGNEVTTSDYSLIGGGTAVADTDLTNGFGSSGGDTGVCNFSDVLTSVNKAYDLAYNTTPANTTSWDTLYSNVFTRSNQYEFDAANSKYIAGGKDTDFGIFNVSSASSGNTYLLNTKYSFFGDASSSTSVVNFKDSRIVKNQDGSIASPTDTTVYSANLASDSSEGTIPDEFKSNIVDKGANRISYLDCAWTVNSTSTNNSTLSDNSGATTTNYSAALFFTTSKPDQDVFYISYRYYNYANSASIALTNISTSDGSTPQPDVSAYYGESVRNAGGLKGTIFSCHRPGNYAIITTTAGVSYSYIRVNGVSGGDFGNVSVGGIAVDFIATGATISTYDVNADNYSGAYFIINIGTAKTFVLYFKRVDVVSPTSITVTAYDASTTTLDTDELQAKGNNSIEATGSPPSS